MSPLIKSLHEYLVLHCEGQIDVEPGDNEMIVAVATSYCPRQRVKVTLEQSRFGEVYLLKLRSRACVARDHRTVTAALESNLDATWTGLALDSQLQPPVINVLYSLPARSLDPREFVFGLTRVASFAAEIGHRTGDAGRF